MDQQQNNLGQPLKLRFDKNRFHSSSLSQILKASKSKLYFRFDGNQIRPLKPNFANDETVSALGTNIKKIIQIKKWKGLKKATFNFLNCQHLTNTGLEILTNQIGSQFASVNYLALNLTNCARITNENVKSLGLEVVRNLRNLDTLVLNFVNCNMIDDKGIRDFFSSWKSNIPNLHHLDLNFTNNRSISDRTLMTIAEKVFRYLKNLQNFTLYFSDCYQISMKGLLVFANYIQKAKNLKHIRLFFPGLKAEDIAITKDIIARSNPKLYIEI